VFLQTSSVNLGFRKTFNNDKNSALFRYSHLPANVPLKWQFGWQHSRTEAIAKLSDSVPSLYSQLCRIKNLENYIKPLLFTTQNPGKDAFFGFYGPMKHLLHHSLYYQPRAQSASPCFNLTYTASVYCTCGCHPILCAHRQQQSVPIL